MPLKKEAPMERPWLGSYDEGVPAEIDFPKTTIDSFLREAGRDYPQRDALIFGARVGSRLMESRISYSRLDEEVDRFGCGLQRMGVGKGDRVALMLPNCPQFVIAAYAVWRIGGIVVCCNPLYMPREIEHLVKDSGTETFIVMSSLYSRVKEIRNASPIKRVIVTNIKEYFPPLLRFLFSLSKEKKEGHRIDISGEQGTIWFQDVFAEKGSKPTSLELTAQDPSTLIYTGGTTGIPKGAQHTHSSQVFNSIALNVWAKSKRGGEVMLAVMPFFHIYGLAVVLNTTIAGALTAVLIPNPRDMLHVLKAIEKYKVTYYLGVPPMFVGFNNHPDVKKYNLSSLRFAASAAAPLAPEVQERFEAITGGKMVEAYGLTETIAATMDPVDHPRPRSIGVPLPNTDVRVVDMETGTKELAPGETGEIVIKGPQVMAGYWRGGEKGSGLRKGPDGEGGWFFSGDIGTMDKDGFFHISDRKKDIIISGGYNIYPTEVEAVLFEHPKVLEAAVIGIPDERRGEAVKAFIVPKQGESLTQEEITAFCRERLAAYKVPKRVEFRGELPKSIIGKVLRRKLREEEAACGKGGVI
jgi:long-chain acyl-CoA synthetase